MWVLSFPVRRLALSQHADKSEVVEKVESERCFWMFVTALPFVHQYGSELGKTPFGRLCWQKWLPSEAAFCLSVTDSEFHLSSLSVYTGRRRGSLLCCINSERDGGSGAPRLVCAFACVRARFPLPHVAKTLINALCKPRRRMSSCLSAFTCGRTLRAPSGPSVQRGALKSLF